MRDDYLCKMETLFHHATRATRARRLAILSRSLRAQVIDQEMHVPRKDCIGKTPSIEGARVYN